jgi:predicted nucleic acid-binding protein
MSNGKFWIDEKEKELVLSDSTGESRFIIEDDLVVEGVKYLVIVDARAGEDADATLVKIINQGEEEIIIPVEEEEEFEKVQAAYLDQE